MDDHEHRRIMALKEAMHDHLHSGIIPFWVERAHDTEYGGYLTNFSAEGVAIGTPEKYLNTQARLTWWFSHLYRIYPSVAAYQTLAASGVDFLIASFWDTKHGGWVWKVRRDGSCLDAGKISYGQSFAMYALAEYYHATSDCHALNYATQTFDLLQKYGADTRWGGYYENLEQDWTISGSGVEAGDRKSLDTHMHLLESFTTLYEASGAPIHRRKLLEIMSLIADRMIDAAVGCGLNQFDVAWTPLPAIAIRRTWNDERRGDVPTAPRETTSYGHNAELVWLMWHAIDVVGADPSSLAPRLRRLLDHALEHGVDWQYGGLYRDGLRDGGPVVLEKEFWQQAEALVGFLDGCLRFGEPRFLDAVECIWRFAWEHMIVQDLGEWRTLLERTGLPIDASIGNPWKVCYHTGRAMLECIARLERLLAHS